MRKLLFLLPVLALLLLGCQEDIYKVYYHGNGATAGKVPVDSETYRSGNSATVKGKGNLKKKDYNFLGWKESNYRETFYDPGDRIYINGDINLYALWDDGADSLFSFIVEDGEVTVTGLNEGTVSFVVIPDTIQGKNVTCIDDTAFGSSSINRVKLPKYLKRIGAGAFAVNRITDITIPDSVETIGMGAFRNNYLGGRVTFGTRLTALESQTFANNRLVEIVVPENIKTVKTGAFAGNNIIFIRLGSNVDIQDDTAFGKYGGQFRTFYNTKGKAAGLYQYSGTNDAWE
jgi:hypothetical protein